MNCKNPDSKSTDGVAVAQHLIDIKELTPNQLAKKYALEYSNHKNMKQRAKNPGIGAIISTEFEVFRDFLAHMGPRPGADYSIDRIDHTNPTYGPGLCRWADKKVQAANRSNVNLLTDSDGTSLPLAVWAQKLAVPKSTLYARQKQGLSDPEIIHGVKPRALNHWPWLDEKKADAMEAYYVEKIALGRVRPETTRLQFTEMCIKPEWSSLHEYFTNAALGDDEAESYKVKLSRYNELQKVLDRVSAIKASLAAADRLKRAARAQAALSEESQAMREALGMG